MRKITAMLAALAMVMTIFMPMAAAYTIPTEAVIVGSTHPPVIERIFVLEDSADPLHVIPGTQILPNPGRGNTENNTEFWKYVIVSDPVGRQDIAAVSEYLINTTGAQGPETAAVKITDQNEWEARLLDALNSKLITFDQYNESKFNLSPLKQQSYMYKVRNTLNNHNAPGIYNVRFKAVDNGGTTTNQNAPFEYVSLKALELDFGAVNYGQIGVGTEKWVPGNDVFTVGGDGLPTLKNQGNTPFQITVNASDLVSVSPGTAGELITADYLSVELLGQHVNNVISVPTPGPGLKQPITLTGLLQPCTPTQISFDIKAPFGTGEGSYQGFMTIVIAP